MRGIGAGGRFAGGGVDRRVSLTCLGRVSDLGHVELLRLTENASVHLIVGDDVDLVALAGRGLISRRVVWTGCNARLRDSPDFVDLVVAVGGRDVLGERLAHVGHAVHVDELDDERLGVVPVVVVSGVACIVKGLH